MGNIGKSENSDKDRQTSYSVVAYFLKHCRDTGQHWPTSTRTKVGTMVAANDMRTSIIRGTPVVATLVDCHDNITLNKSQDLR